MKRLLLVLVVGLVFVPALPADAKSFWLTHADVEITLNDDGSLDVVESITFDFDGSFSGAYRDIPLASGATVSDIRVADETIEFAPGGCTTLGCSSPPGTYGVELNPSYVRIVWHHASFDQLRTFRISYELTGIAVAWDDVVDINLKVWGDQWAVGLDTLESTMNLPSGLSEGEVRVWGHPFGVNGETSLGDDGVSPSLRASGIPSEQWVEMRVVIPTSSLASTDGAILVSGEGLPQILAEEEEFANDAEEAAQAGRTGLIVGALGVLVPLLGLGGFVYFGYGREHRVDYDRDYEQEPPSDLKPAEVGALLSQGGVDERDFTATLFDLIRQGAINAEPTQIERVTWAGLRKEMISDLSLSLGEKQTGLRDFEQSVMTVVKRVLDDGPTPLHEFRTAIREDAAANAETYQSFSQKVREAVRRSGLIDDRGSAIASLIGVGLALATFGAFFLLPNVLRDRPGGATIAVLSLVGLVVGTVLTIFVISFRRVRVRRSKEGALEAARWDAFRKYLSDFSRLHEAPSISLDLWDRYLVYAIGFGVATEVLEHARLHAPEVLESTSSLYWYGSHGYSGGSTENAFSGLESALSGAFTPPSSSSGGGGGFSGRGGGGGGGGGGGAW